MKTTVATIDFGTSKIVTLVAENSGSQRCDIVAAGISRYDGYLEEGWIPIIAHAERYCRTFATEENISILKEMGCLVQINYYDLAEEHDDEIRRCAQALVEAELADMTGSDCHRMNHRSPALEEGIRYIREHCRADYAEDLLWRNAQRLLCDHSPGL